MAVVAVTRAYDKEAPLETSERHCLSLQESPFGNEATKVWFSSQKRSL